MNYVKIHDAIILRAKSRKKPDCYCEKHHIVPRSLGGGDERDNIAVLTAREHFIIHWLLWKIHKNKQMLFAFHKMTHSVGNGRERYTSRSFAYARQAFGKWISENRSGANSSSYGKYGADSSSFGTRRTDESKKLLSDAAKQRVANGIIPRAKKVINLDTGATFRSALEANRHTKGNVVYAIANGGTAGGHRYAYVDDNDNPIIVETKLKGYATGQRSALTKDIIRESTGEIFHTLSDAGNSVGVTGTAVAYAIKDNRKCKGEYFRYV